MKNTLYGGKMAARLIRDARVLYMLGIGGVGMSALAVIADERGLSVRGEDRAETDTVKMLMQRGIHVSRAYEGLGDVCDALIYSAAIPPSHPAFAEATARGLPILSRSDYLAALMEGSRRRVTVAGIHGKSTVTAMLDRILVKSGLSPSTVSGASLFDGASFRMGVGDVFLAEACEYTDSFLSFSPTVAVALNLEHDHPDYFRDEESIAKSFAAYLANAEAAAVLPSVGPLLSLAPRDLPLYTFGSGGSLTARAVRQEQNGSTFELWYKETPCARMRLPLLGAYQIDNALAAILTAKLLGVPFADAVEALSDFVSPNRRCKLRFVRNGVRYIDDYAHHPSEIRAVLSALRPTCQGRLVCAFEAHTYSRLAAFRSGFIEALSLADAVVVLPIYPARETDTLGESEGRLAESLSVPTVAFTELESAAEYLKESTASGDTVAVLGAGNTPRLFELLSD